MYTKDFFTNTFIYWKTVLCLYFLSFLPSPCPILDFSPLPPQPKGEGGISWRLKDGPSRNDRVRFFSSKKLHWTALVFLTKLWEYLKYETYSTLMFDVHVRRSLLIFFGRWILRRTEIKGLLSYPYLSTKPVSTSIWGTPFCPFRTGRGVARITKTLQLTENSWAYQGKQRGVARITETLK